MEVRRESDPGARVRPRGCDGAARRRVRMFLHHAGGIADWVLPSRTHSTGDRTGRRAADAGYAGGARFGCGRSLCARKRLEVRGNLVWSAHDFAAERDLRNWRTLKMRA